MTHCKVICKNGERSASAPQPALPWCPVLQCRDSLSPSVLPPGVQWDFHQALLLEGWPSWDGDVGGPLTPTVQLYWHTGPGPGVASLSPFICLFCELRSFFPWRKDTSSNLAEGENLSHTCLLWLWYPAHGKGQSPGVMVQGAEVIEGKDVHPAFSWTRSL